MYLLWILLKFCYKYDYMFFGDSANTVISICKYLYKTYKYIYNGRKKENIKYLYTCVRYDTEDDLVIIE